MVSIPDDFTESSGLRVFACLASSLDGSIGPANVDNYTRISSDADIEHLKQLRNDADVLLFGAETFRTYPVRHKAADSSHFPLHLIMSQAVDLDWEADLFHEPALSVGIVSPLPANHWPGTHPRGILHVPVPGDGPEADLNSLLEYLVKNGYHSLMVEGGGSIIRQFMEARLLGELYLTLTPTLIGQQDAPRLIQGSIPFKGGIRTKILSSHAEQGDIFLHLRISYPEQPVDSL